MRAIPVIILSLAAAVAASPSTAADAPYSPAARGFVAVDDAGLPGCDSPRVFRRITGAFHDKEREYWNSGLRIGAFEPAVEVALRPWGLDFIPRRFCQTYATTSDGVRREVLYSIGKNTGTLGVADGISWCVTGTDYNWAFNPACRMAGP